MKNMYKYVILYVGFVLLSFFVVFGINTLRDKNIELQEEVLLKQAQTHFQNQVNIREWNEGHAGVYVKPLGGLKPNIYLRNNTLKTADGETLIKINPAWMTRQLSELSDTSGFSFRITSENPINPNNITNAFEARALKYIRETDSKEYYEIEHGKDFKYMGALVTKRSCLPCHAHQGYKIGDIRGGISVSLDSGDYETIVDYITNRAMSAKILVIFLLFSIVILIHKQLKYSANLQEEVLKQTKEIKTTRKLLQEVLDADHSFLMVAEGRKIILTNKTMLDFFNVSSLEVFLKKYTLISNFFIPQEDENFLSEYVDGEHWIPYLNREQNNKNLKVMMKKKDDVRCFKPHTKELTIDNKELNIIIFDDITNEMEKINSLEEKASRDDLTGLFNRGKFNDVLSKEIALSRTISSPLSIIFLDIDHFKVVNDTYGHDAGDYVLVELAKILESNVRKSDFVARWGGEEFVITLQTTNVEEASLLAENLRIATEHYNFLNGGKQTISLGVTQYKNGEFQADFIKRVDDALYEAKETGRNKVVVK